MPIVSLFCPCCCRTTFSLSCADPNRAPVVVSMTFPILTWPELNPLTHYTGVHESIKASEAYSFLMEKLVLSTDFSEQMDIHCHLLKVIRSAESGPIAKKRNNYVHNVVSRYVKTTNLILSSGFHLSGAHFSNFCGRLGYAVFTFVDLLLSDCESPVVAAPEGLHEYVNRECAFEVATLSAGVLLKLVLNYSQSGSSNDMSDSAVLAVCLPLLRQIHALSLLSSSGFLISKLSVQLQEYSNPVQDRTDVTSVHLSLFLVVDAFLSDESHIGVSGTGGASEKRLAVIQDLLNSSSKLCLCLDAALCLLKTLPGTPFAHSLREYIVRILSQRDTPTPITDMRVLRRYNIPSMMGSILELSINAKGEPAAPLVKATSGCRESSSNPFQAWFAAAQSVIRTLLLVDSSSQIPRLLQAIKQCHSDSTRAQLNSLLQRALSKGDIDLPSSAVVAILEYIEAELKSDLKSSETLGQRLDSLHCLISLLMTVSRGEVRLEQASLCQKVLAQLEGLGRLVSRLEQSAKFPNGGSMLLASVQYAIAHLGK